MRLKKAKCHACLRAMSQSDASDIAQLNDSHSDIVDAVFK